MNLIPWILVWFRLVLAPIFFVGFLLETKGGFYVVLLVAGLFSDIFDGVLARRWKCSTPPLRRLDTNVDTIFYGAAGITAALLHATYLGPWRWALGMMFLFMITQNVVNILRYGKQPSYHMWSGKLWGIVLIVTLSGLFADRPSSLALGATVALGIYNSSEDIFASLILPKPLTDIPTLFHAIRLVRKMRSSPTNAGGRA